MGGSALPPLPPHALLAITAHSVLAIAEYYIRDYCIFSFSNC